MDPLSQRIVMLTDMMVRKPSPKIQAELRQAIQQQAARNQMADTTTRAGFEAESLKRQRSTTRQTPPKVPGRPPPPPTSTSPPSPPTSTSPSTSTPPSTSTTQTDQVIPGPTNNALANFLFPQVQAMEQAADDIYTYQVEQDKIDTTRRDIVLLGGALVLLYTTYKVWEDPKIITEIGYLFEAIYHIMLGLIAVVVIGYPTYVVLSCVAEGKTSVTDIISCSIEKMINDIISLVGAILGGIISAIFTVMDTSSGWKNDDGSINWKNVAVSWAEGPIGIGYGAYETFK